MYKRLYEFLDKMDAFYSLQFCFREKHSTNHALITLYNVCSVHREMFSTLGVFSTSRDTMSTSWEYREYIGGVQYIGGYHEYIGGCSVHQGDTMMHVRGTMSTSGDVQYIEGIS